jgi:hypothetical protein
MNWLEQINIDLKKAQKAEKCRLWYLKNRERILARQKTYVEANEEKIIQRAKDRRLRNRDKELAKGKKYCTEHKAVVIESRKKWMAKPENRKKWNTYKTAWRAKNKDKEKKTNQRYSKKRREKLKNDPRFKINKTVSGYIRTVLKGKKSESWTKLVPYTLEQLMRHLESQFTKGMTWQNYGFRGWHVDHIKPVCSFQFTNPTDEEFQKCWALENLRPLWATDNIRKATEDRKLSVKNLCTK